MSPENTSQNGSFMIQIGSYREEATAQSSVKRLSEKGYQAHLRMKDIPQKEENGFELRVALLRPNPRPKKWSKS